jgi:hypothetical protein
MARKNTASSNLKTATPTSDRLTIQNEMRCFDLKDRDFYDSLTDEERKKFSNYLMIRWGSAVEASADMQKFYVIATNERLNKHFFAVNRHPKLQWLMATSVSPGLGVQRHNWIAPKKKESGNSAKKKFLLEIYPAMKATDVDVLCTVMTDAELKQLQRDHGVER